MAEKVESMTHDLTGRHIESLNGPSVDASVPPPPEALIPPVVDAVSFDLIVMREQKTNAKLARELKVALKENHRLTVQELAEKLEVPIDQVVHVLDTYHPGGKQMGVGKGGPWMPPEKAADIITTP